MANKETAKTWFETGDYPTQAQFWQVFEWLFWKDDGIAMSNVTGLQDALNTLQATLNAALPNQIVSGGTVTIDVDDGTTLRVKYPPTVYKLKGVPYTCVAGTKDLPLRPSTPGQFRIDVFYLDNTGFKALTGAVSATPVKPVVPVGGVELSSILIGFDNVIETSSPPDIVIPDFANRASFPTVGAANKLYVARDTRTVYWWDASVTDYVAVGGGGGGGLDEAGVRNTQLTGLDKTSATEIEDTDSVLSAFGRLQKQITDFPAAAWGSITGTLSAQSDLTAYIAAQAANGNTAFGWGNHALAGYLTSGTLPSDVTRMGNAFNGPSQLVFLNSERKLPAVDGSLLTNLQVANWVQSGANVYYNGGNVGIGTGEPTQKFQIDDSGLGIRTSAFSLINNDTTDPGGAANTVAHYSPDIYMSAYGWDQTNNIPRRVDAYMRLTTIRHTASNQFGGFKLAYQVDGYTEKQMISVNSSQVFSFGWSNSFSLQTAGISGMAGFSVFNGIMTLSRSTSGQTLDGLTVAGTSYGGGSGHSMWSVLQGLSATASDYYRFGMYLNVPATAGSLQEWSVRYSFWKEGSRTEIAAFYNDASLTLGGITKYDSALLNLESTTKGFLPPRMTTSQRDAIASPAEGLVIYNTTTKKLNLFTTAWEQVTST